MEYSLELAFNLKKDVSAEEADKLASIIIESEKTSNKQRAYEAAVALCNIGGCRTEGLGYSEEVSDIVASWVNDVFDESNIEFCHRLAEVLCELTSSKAKEITLNLYHKANNPNVKEQLIEAYMYGGT
ncbi:hypothetical protein ACJJIL_23480 (plasmid) [Microbulbifer sp. EKSA005]|uniref:hypothetical protein n=1 Tax=Microbulbifer sp. EKSA005 TaxID=3243364 RepID=UPI004042806C